MLGLVGLAILLYFIGVGVNWRDQPPSAAALEMKRFLADRAPVADTDNGFVYVLGFGVPASEDPQAAGALRKAWMESANLDPKQFDAEPPKEIRQLQRLAAHQSVDAVKKSCGETRSVKCRDAFLAALPKPRMALEDLQLARYRALLQRPAWREVVPARCAHAAATVRRHLRWPTASVRRPRRASEIRAAGRDRFGAA